MYEASLFTIMHQIQLTLIQLCYTWVQEKAISYGVITTGERTICDLVGKTEVNFE
jgi:hypothetical protein